MVNLEDEWGLHPAFAKLSQSDDGDYEPVTVLNVSNNPALPASLDWHSGMIFTNCDNAWHTVYARGTNAVVLEQKIRQRLRGGRGRLLFPEQRSHDQEPARFCWIFWPGSWGDSSHVVFDESHFGIVDSSGVATLMRQYRLHGLVVGLLLLAVLYIWKNSTSLVPPYADQKRDDTVAGKDAASGFVNLLRRNIPRSEVLGVCFAQWHKSAAPTSTVSTPRQRQAEAIFSGGKIPARHPGAIPWPLIKKFPKHFRQSKTTIMNTERLKEVLTQARHETGKVIIGQGEVVEKALIAIFTGSHALIEGVPGVAKTLLVRTLAHVLGADFARIQFTPDLMPADITGTNVFNLQRNEFSLIKGPVFTSFLLADEINRAPAKTQSALLQAMQERTVTIDRETHLLPSIFTVFATQNPVEYEGTYPLPEAQKDRFMLKITMSSPDRAEELALAQRTMTKEAPEISCSRKASCRP